MKTASLLKSASQGGHPDAERWAATADKPGRAVARSGATGPIEQPAAQPRILIVEDDFLVAADVEAALLDAGLDVVGVAETADSALALAMAQKPTLVLMDIRLAGVRDGIDAAIEIHRVLGTRCLFTSAHSDGPARSRAEPAQPLGWLQKPYSMGQLVDAVRQALAGMV
jgi:DNA-binding NarL/FixJ family response regulator